MKLSTCVNFMKKTLQHNLCAQQVNPKQILRHYTDRSIKYVKKNFEIGHSCVWLFYRHWLFTAVVKTSTVYGCIYKRQLFIVALQSSDDKGFLKRSNCLWLFCRHQLIIAVIQASADYGCCIYFSFLSCFIDINCL